MDDHRTRERIERERYNGLIPLVMIAVFLLLLGWLVSDVSVTSDVGATNEASGVPQPGAPVGPAR